MEGIHLRKKAGVPEALLHHSIRTWPSKQIPMQVAESDRLILVQQPSPPFTKCRYLENYLTITFTILREAIGWMERTVCIDRESRTRWVVQNETKVFMDEVTLQKAKHCGCYTTNINTEGPGTVLYVSMTLTHCSFLEIYYCSFIIIIIACKFRSCPLNSTFFPEELLQLTKAVYHHYLKHY